MRNYKGLNLTRLQILDVLGEEKPSGSTIEKMIYGKELTGPYKDLFIKDLDWLVEKNYVTQHEHDPEGTPLRYFHYGITSEGREIKNSAHAGWIHVIYMEEQNKDKKD